MFHIYFFFYNLCFLCPISDIFAYVSVTEVLLQGVYCKHELFLGGSGCVQRSLYARREQERAQVHFSDAVS